MTPLTPAEYEDFHRSYDSWLPDDDDSSFERYVELRRARPDFTPPPSLGKRWSFPAIPTPNIGCSHAE